MVKERATLFKNVFPPTSENLAVVKERVRIYKKTSIVFFIIVALSLTTARFCLRKEKQ